MVFPTDQLTETVTVHPFAGSGAYQRQFGDDYDLPACVQAGFSVILNKLGERVTATAFAIFGAECALKPDDEVTWEGERYRVASAKTLKLEGRPHHAEVYLTSVTSP